MEKFRKKIDWYVHRVESRWNSLSRTRQRMFTRLLLVVYILLTAVTVIYLWSGENSSLPISHINRIPQNLTLKNTAP